MQQSLSHLLRRRLPELFGEDVHLALSGKMEAAISDWAAEYEGKPPWEKKNVKSIGIAAGIAAEIAKLSVLEAEITVTGSPRAEFHNEALSELYKELGGCVELACALGGMVFKPYVAGGKILIDTVQGDCFFPTAFDSSRRMTGCLFIDQLVKGKETYTRLELHEYKAGSHRVQNRALISRSGAPWREIELSSVPEWQDIAKDFIFENVERPLFSYFKIPGINRTERMSPLGASVYANAEGLLQDADEQYSRYLWEFEGGEMAVDASEDYLKPTMSGEKELPHNRERLFRQLNTADPNFYNVFAPALRDEALRRGLNTILQRIEFNCGVAYGTLSDPQTVEKTAEEIRSSKMRSYTTAGSIQRALEDAISELVYAMDIVTTAYNLAPAGDYEITFDWGDSIIDDPTEKKRRFWEYVIAGKFPMKSYLEKFEGYSADEAAELASPGATDFFKEE